MIRKRFLTTISSLLSVFLVMSLSGCSLIPKEQQNSQIQIDRSDEVSPNYISTEVMRGDLQKCVTTRFTYTTEEVQEGQFEIANEEISSINVVFGDLVKAGDVLAELDVTKQKRELAALASDYNSLAEEKKYLEQLIDLTKREKNLTYGTSKYIDEELVDYESKRNQVDDEIEINQMEQAEKEEEIAGRQIRAQFDGSIAYVLPIRQGEKSELDKNYVKVAGNSFQFKGTTDEPDSFPIGSEMNLVMENAKESSLVGTTLKAVVTQAEVSEDSRVTSLVLSLKEANYDLASGDEAVVSVIKEESRGCLYVPIKYLTFVNGKTVVCVPDKDGIRVIREVTTGVTNDEFVEIKEGLSEGEKIIQ